MPPSSVTLLPPPPIPFIQPQQQTHVPTPTIVPCTSLQNLPTFGSLFKFEDRVKALEDNFLEFQQTNQFDAVSDRLRDEAQAENEHFINTLNENMRKIIKKQVKEQVKEQVSKILPKIEKFVNDQLEAEYNKSIDRSIQHKTLYNALVDAYETDKDILETYGDTVTFKRRRDDEDEDKEPSAGSNWGPREEVLEKNLNQLSAQAEEPIHANEDLEEPAHQEFDTGFTEDQPVDETTQHLIGFRNQQNLQLPTVIGTRLYLLNMDLINLG
ncbi:hypothetical protein Tco_0004293 [Tanacetum coccineum]